MNELQEKIWETIDTQKKNTLKRSDLERLLGISGGKETALFTNAVEALEAEYRICRNRDQTYMTDRQAGYITGVIRFNKAGNAFVSGTDETLKIYEENVNDALPGDTVVAEKIREDTGRVLYIRSHGKTHVTGTFTATARGLKCFLDEDILNRRVTVITIPKDMHPYDGMVVSLRIEKYGRPLRLCAERVLGNKNDPGTEVAARLIAHEIDPVFPQEVLQEADRIYHEVSEEEKKNRTDLTMEHVFTIDGDDSKDFDDAVSITRKGENYLLKVSIADVSHYVREGSLIDQEAYLRGTSVYAADTVVPMLPQILSNGICSLNPNELRLTMTCEMEITPEGRTASYRIYESYIRSAARMTYRAVNAFLKDHEQPQVFPEDILLLKECTDCIRKYRVEKGALNFEAPETEVIVNSVGYAVDIRPRERGEAEMMIEDCMIAANICVAEYLIRNSIPGVYRIHEAPDIKKLREFASFSSVFGYQISLGDKTPAPKDLQAYQNEIKGAEEETILSGRLLRCMQKARYDSACLGHYGLSEKYYLHFTSPIRRYPDLAVHRMLKAYCFAEEAHDTRKRDERKMKEIAVQSSLRERIAVDAERDITSMKIAEYMSSRIGTVQEGMITSVTSFGIFVTLPNTAEGLITPERMGEDYFIYSDRHETFTGARTNKVYRLGDKLKIKVIAANVKAGTVDFEPAEKVTAVKPKENRRNRKGGRSRGKKRW